MPVQLAYSCLLVDDVERSIGFYAGLAGLQVSADAGWYAELSPPEDRRAIAVAVCQRAHPSLPVGTDGGHGGVLVTLVVDDVDEAARRARALGASLALPCRDEEFGQRHFMALDPDGFLVDVVQRIPASVAFLRLLADRRQATIVTAPRYGIGEFSRLTRLTVTTLRHYDDIGLLKPAAVDTVTGYRRYSDAQIADALRLGLYRSIGVPIDELRRLADGNLTEDDVIGRHRRRLEADISDRQRALTVLDGLVRTPPALPSPTLTTVPRRRVATLSRVTTWDKAGATTRHALARLQVLLRRRAVGTEPPPSALFPVSPADELTVVVFIGLSGDARLGPTASGEPGERELPGGDALVLEHVGSHLLLPAVYRSLLAAVRGRGLRATGLVCEEYVEDEPTPRTRLVLPVLPG